MERGQSKAVTGKGHLERNDLIIEKQKAELQRIDAEKRHKEQQVNLAELELKQVKSEIRTDKLKSAATDAACEIEAIKKVRANPHIPEDAKPELPEGY